jgi:hypothetical protein
MNQEQIEYLAKLEFAHNQLHLLLHGVNTKSFSTVFPELNYLNYSVDKEIGILTNSLIKSCSDIFDTRQKIIEHMNKNISNI